MSKQQNEIVMESLKSSLKKDEIDLETEKIKFINEIGVSVLKTLA